MNHVLENDAATFKKRKSEIKNMVQVIGGSSQGHPEVVTIGAILWELREQQVL